MLMRVMLCVVAMVLVAAMLLGRDLGHFRSVRNGAGCGDFAGTSSRDRQRDPGCGCPPPDRPRRPGQAASGDRIPGGMDVLCTDKTGTLTVGSIALERQPWTLRDKRRHRCCGWRR